MSDGIGCVCAARSEYECCCDADWRPQELIDLQQQLASRDAEVVSHAEHAEQGKTVWTLFNAVTEAIKPSNVERAHILGAWNRTVPLTQYLDQGIGLIH